MAQWVEYLLCKHDDLNSHPSTMEKLGVPEEVGIKTVDPYVSLKLTEQTIHAVSPRLSEKPFAKHEAETNRGRYWMLTSSLHVNTHL